MPRSRPWLPEHTKLLRKLWADGTLVKAIAEQLDRSQGGVLKQAAKLKLPRRRVAKLTGELPELQRVSAMIPPELVPAWGKRSEVISEALELRQGLRTAGVEGTTAEIVARVVGEV